MLQIHCLLMITTLPWILILFPISQIGILRLRKFKWLASSLRAELFIRPLCSPHCIPKKNAFFVLFCFCFLPTRVGVVKVSRIGKNQTIRKSWGKKKSMGGLISGVNYTKHYWLNNCVDPEII